MTGVVPVIPRFRFNDATGTPIVGGSVTVYLAGTTTLATTYQDQALTIQNTNPVTLDANGECLFWVDPNLTYKLLLKDASGATVSGWPVDNITGAGSQAGFTAALATAVASASAAAAASATAAANSATSAASAAATANAYPNSAASAVPRQIVQSGVGAITGGSGGTNGTFNAAFSAGTGWLIYPTATFTVSGGAVTAFTITSGGLCISASFAVPTVSFAASAGLTGAAVALTSSVIIASGSGYWVTSTDGMQLDRYNNVSGVATRDTTVASIPSAAISTRSLKYEFGVADANGNLGHYVDNSGVSPAARAAYTTGSLYDYDINGFFIYGQSLAVGQATPAISKVQNYDNLMFVDGLRHQYDNPTDIDSVAYASFVPAVEVQSPLQTTLAETPCMGAGDMIKQIMLDEEGLAYTAQNYQILLSAPGFGAQTIAQLSKGTGNYTRLMTQVAYATANAATLNKTFAMQAVGWIQGENDYLGGTTQAAYLTSLNTLITNLNTDTKAAAVAGPPPSGGTGQTKSVKVIGYQLASHKVNGATTPSIALAQLQCTNSNALFIIATPMYHFRYQDQGNNHLQAIESRELGAWLGLAYYRSVIRQQAWLPLQPTASTTTGKLAVLTFNVPVGNLVFDTDMVAANTNMGFELVDSGGSPLTISSVALRGGNQVKITAAATIPAGAKVRYAWSGTGNVGNTVGPRGNLRDQQGDDAPGRRGRRFDRDGINKPMHNWCVIFEWSL